MSSKTSQALHGTNPLTFEGDLAAEMVEGLDGYVTDAVASSVEKREALWHRDYSSHEAYTESVEPNRERFKKQIGCIDERLPIQELHYIATTSDPAQIVEDEHYTVSRVRWQVFDDEVGGEGLLLEPRHNVPITAQIVALPDADCTPEAIAGVTDELPPNTQFARRLAKAGCRVVVPLLINRDDTYSGNPTLEAMTNQPHREFIYRMAYQLGRHIIGYEVQKVLSVVDWMSLTELPIGVIGYGEGGLIAFYSAAVDTRIQATAVSGYFQSRQSVWREPIYRNVWGLLHEFGDAEIASLIAPRPLIIEASRGPEIAGPPTPQPGRGGAAPGQLVSPPIDSVESEFNRAIDFYQRLSSEDALRLVSTEDGAPGSQETLTTLLAGLGIEKAHIDGYLSSVPAVGNFDAEARQERQFTQLVNLTQRFLREAASRRKQFFWDKTDTSSLTRWQETAADAKIYFSDEVIGRCPSPDVPTNPRTRLIYDEPLWKGYEVVLDVWKDVFAYGILLLPSDLQPGEQRPVVVCQHGLEGRPQDTADPGIESVYYAYAAQLADRGFITYAPQNPYIGQDAFRVIQRKANPIKWSLFSLIVRQHERTLDWLAAQPFVDADRIGFYGLSYGGKTAMRVPALLDRYACSICSADFNEWIVKNATVDARYSYMFTGEYEMPEFDLGNTFNYGEMAGLIAPRPFMVERGHDDGVAPDEWVAHEYAVVRRLYVRLGIADRTEIEFFDGGHQINSDSTFKFLHRHLNWPEPS